MYYKYEGPRLCGITDRDEILNAVIDWMIETGCRLTTDGVHRISEDDIKRYVPEFFVAEVESMLDDIEDMLWLREEVLDFERYTENGVCQFSVNFFTNFCPNAE